MGVYAASTTVSVAKSRLEIEALITRYGATGFANAFQPGLAILVFVIEARQVRFELPLPDRSEFQLRPYRGSTRENTHQEIEVAWEQACRQRWRALALVIKAKLEAVDSGITTFEDEFLAHIVTPDGSTIGSRVRPQLAAMYSTGKMPPLLGSGS